MSEMKFEKAIKRLEAIVEQLEDGQIDLEKSLKLFEEGIKLARFCADKLQEAEQKIELLALEHEGLFAADPPEPEADEEETKP
ncbi:MAG: exodeoxyribonuclease VII small subunit [Nitrospinae bacterium]|jgi:exodeoxyribonuclease VII small subunit|nr:exodeoxyribonuclease VII small subunit [Nitrospinota bacterium]MCH7768452.1 exodeoxyribonuclease VII small subunit [Nitrospinota bacterium]MDV2479719.1 exodeoxyribonuclease VII small subunit [bacterium]